MARSGLERVGLASRIPMNFRSRNAARGGQGIVAVECAINDWQTRRILWMIDDLASHRSADAEREVLWVSTAIAIRRSRIFNHSGHADVADRVGAG